MTDEEMLDEMREAIRERLAWMHIVPERRVGDRAIDQILSLETDHCRIAVVRKRGDLPDCGVFRRIDYIHKLIDKGGWTYDKVLLSQQCPVLKAGYVQEICNDVKLNPPGYLEHKERR